tara:strand:- start:3 stop:410 length:408 start_codon:yes stop_codon:yes gene_type:complete
LCCFFYEASPRTNTDDDGVCEKHIAIKEQKRKKQVQVFHKVNLSQHIVSVTAKVELYENVKSQAALNYLQGEHETIEEKLKTSPPKLSHRGDYVQTAQVKSKCNWRRNGRWARMPFETRHSDDHQHNRGQVPDER